MRTHYDNLRVTRNAEPEVIKAAYRALANKWHPDKAQTHQKEKANRYTQIINGSFAVLSDPARRKAYDEHLSVESRSGSHADTDTQPQPCQACLEHERSLDSFAEYFFSLKTAASLVIVVAIILGAAWQAWSGDKISIVVLAAFALVWLCFFVLFGWSLRNTEGEKSGLPAVIRRSMTSRS